MNTITVKDKEFKLSISAEEINSVVKELASRLNHDLKGKNPIFLVVLNGAFIFAADLYRKIEIPSEISFVKLASYSGTSTTSDVKELIGLNEKLKGRTVVIIEDIIDTGITMDNIIGKLKNLEAADVKLAALLFKPGAFVKDFHIDYIGLEIPNDFIVGYGLDYNGLARNYPDIYRIVAPE